MANNGIHSLDIARWGLGVDLPERVTYNGDRYYYDDDQETPDTGEATFHFGDCYASWSGSSCDPRRDEKLPFCKFYGEGGSMVMSGGNGYQILDRDGKEVDAKSGPGGEPAHCPLGVLPQHLFNDQQLVVAVSISEPFPQFFSSGFIVGKMVFSVIGTIGIGKSFSLSPWAAWASLRFSTRSICSYLRILMYSSSSSSGSN